MYNYLSQENLLNHQNIYERKMLSTKTVPNRYINGLQAKANRNIHPYTPYLDTYGASRNEERSVNFNRMFASPPLIFDGNKYDAMMNGALQNYPSRHEGIFPVMSANQKLTATPRRRSSEDIRLSSPYSDGRVSAFSITSSTSSKSPSLSESPSFSDKFIPSPTTSDTTEDETDEYLDVESLDDDVITSDKKEKQEYETIGDDTLIKKEKSKNSNRNKLWKFLLKLLEEDKDEYYIRWTNRSQGEFRMIKTGAVAALWGRSNNRKNMTYEKMTRAMRYYYKMKVIKKVPHKNLHYQFGPSIMAKVVFNETSKKHVRKNTLNTILTENDKNFIANFNKESATTTHITSNQFIRNVPHNGQTDFHNFVFGQNTKTRIIFPTQFRNPFL